MASPEEAKKKLHVANRAHSFDLLIQLRILARERIRIKKLIDQQGNTPVTKLLEHELESICRQERTLTATSLQVTRVNRSAETMIASTAAIEAVEAINAVCMDVRAPNRDPEKTSEKWQKQAFVRIYFFYIDFYFFFRVQVGFLINLT